MGPHGKLGTELVQVLFPIPYLCPQSPLQFGAYVNCIAILLWAVPQDQEPYVFYLFVEGGLDQG